MQSFFDLFARYLADKAKSQELYVSALFCSIFSRPCEACIYVIDL